jgi:hypothetical protein
MRIFIRNLNIIFIIVFEAGTLDGTGFTRNSHLRQPDVVVSL